MPLPTPPGRRLAYDADGTQMLHKKDSAPSPVAMSPTDVLVINNESSNGINLEDDWLWGSNESGWVIALFAEPKDQAGGFISYNADSFANLAQLEGSTDTTTGMDGIWTTIIANLADSLPSDAYRTAIDAYTELALTGLRFRCTNWPGDLFRNWHIYAKPGAAATDDRLIFLDPTTPPTILKDWGDQGQGQLTKQQFAVQNTADTETAQSITLAVEAFTGPSQAWYEFSIDDTIYTAALNIGDLVAGATTTFWLKQDLPQAAPLAQQAARISAEAASWV